jgi:hypothetical protein
MMRLANATNGLCFPPFDAVCMFQSQHGHHMRSGYFRWDAMPWDAVVHLLQGGQVTIVDATRRHKSMTDAQKFGVATWCLVFNRAIRDRETLVCTWQTPEMRRVALSELHEPYMRSIRKLANLLGSHRPAIIGQTVILECHQAFDADDKPKRLRARISGGV